MPPATLIAIVGAESTGKTTLARTLASALAERLPATASAPAPRIAWVPEWLREWCDAQGRTPRADEQAAIAHVQHERIRSAALAHDIVVCDTTALMTAVYSQLLFADRSLGDMAAHLHRDISLTLLTALDLPWVSDGHQRDGPQVREPVDDLLRALLHAHRLPYAVVAGHGAQRLAQAEAAVLKALSPGRAGGADPADASATCASPPALAAPRRDAGRRDPGTPPAPREIAPHRRRSLFSDLADTDIPPLRRWICECCVPEAEQALLRQGQARVQRDRSGQNTS